MDHDSPPRRIPPGGGLSPDLLVGALRASSIAVSFTDAGGFFLWVNPAFTRITGYTLADVAGKTARIFRAGKHDDAFYESIWKTISSGREWRGDLVRARKDGSLYVAALTVCPVLDDRGQVANYIDYHDDATEQRDLAARLRAAERMASVGLLAAGTAHEINNPLGFVAANVDLALEEVGRALSTEGGERGALERVRAMLEETREGVGRVRGIVRDLGTFARDDGAARAPVDLRPLLETAARMAHNEIRHRATVVMDLGAAPPVLAEGGRILQVAINLIVNAAQSIEPGAVDRNTIRVRTSTDAEGRAVAEISDTGSGMTPAVRERIFEPFFTTKPVGAGTGLGLSICRNIVTQLGGSIEVESEPGRGSVFRVVLPATREVSAPPVTTATATAEAAPPAARARRARVLVIDDERALVKAVTRALEPDHDVVTTTDARRALELLETGDAFDVVLCDLMMPDLTGMDIYEAVRARDPRAAERMVFVTGGAFTDRAATFLRSVSNRCIEKPFDVVRLRQVVRDVAGECYLPGP